MSIITRKLFCCVKSERLSIAIDDEKEHLAENGGASVDSDVVKKPLEIYDEPQDPAAVEEDLNCEKSSCVSAEPISEPSIENSVSVLDAEPLCDKKDISEISACNPNAEESVPECEDLTKMESEEAEVEVLVPDATGDAELITSVTDVEISQPYVTEELSSTRWTENFEGEPVGEDQLAKSTKEDKEFICDPSADDVSEMAHELGDILQSLKNEMNTVDFVDDEKLKMLERLIERLEAVADALDSEDLYM